jgi:uncharacterized membrane protein YphA (DoxX/SURF4 family)
LSRAFDHLTRALRAPEEVLPVSRRYAISTATVVMLVLLRLNIGWHFFNEGVKHYSDPQWTSEGTLRAAKGPLAPFYQGYLPDFHGMQAWLHDESAQKASSAVSGFIDKVQDDWDKYRQQFAMHYGLDAAQQKRAAQLMREHQAEIRSWGSANRDALEAHVHQWQRQESASKAAGADVPFQKQRLAGWQAALNGELATWRAELEGLERDYENDLGALLPDEQRDASPMPRRATSIALVDAVMTYVILAIGVLLLLGLLTRTACVAGAVFLMSVVSMQPFWVSEAIPTYNQLVEMFALLMLATTHVGRWGGLDFFVHKWIFASARRDERQTDALDS